MYFNNVMHYLMHLLLVLRAYSMCGYNIYNALLRPDTINDESLAWLKCGEST